MEITNKFELFDGEPFVVVAMDHSSVVGQVKEGFEKPYEVMNLVKETDADGALLSYGMLKHVPEELEDVPSILRIDAGKSEYQEQWSHNTEWQQRFTVKDAVEVGADSVVVMLWLGGPVELQSTKMLSRVAAEAEEYDIPVVVETIPQRGSVIPDVFDPEVVADVSRLAFELGADCIKSYYTGDPDGFRHVTESVPIPVGLLGGPKTENIREVFELVHGGIQAGAQGVYFGRNIWKHENPSAMVEALQTIVKGKGTPEDALEVLSA